MLKKFPSQTQEYSRILSAAVVNSSFRSMLLTNPARAIRSGYSGEKFNLDQADQNRLSSIRAAWRGRLRQPAGQPLTHTTRSNFMKNNIAKLASELQGTRGRFVLFLLTIALFVLSAGAPAATIGIGK